MQEISSLSQQFINNSKQSSSFIKKFKNLLCPQKMKADLVCIQEKCQKYPFFTNQCQVCSSQHQLCSLVLLKHVNERIINKMQNKKQQMSASSNQIDNQLDKIVQKIQKVRQQFQLNLCMTFLSQEEAQYVKLTTDNNQNSEKKIQRMPKKKLLSIIKNLNQKKKQKQTQQPSNHVQFVTLLKKELKFKMKQIQFDNQQQNSIIKKQQIDKQIYLQLQSKKLHQKLSEQDKQFIIEKVQKNLKRFGYQETSIHFTFDIFNDEKISPQQLILFLRNSKLINPFKIKNLYLQNNSINDEVIKQLCKKQNQWIQLKILSLSKNKITMKGVKYLSQAANMRRFMQLSQLNLQNNNIGSNENLNREQFIEEGLILKFSDQNTKLKFLSLEKNKINDNDIQILFKFIEDKREHSYKIFSYLQSLNLSDNAINKCEIKPLEKDFFQFYPQIKNLTLSCNKLDSDSIKYLFDNINQELSSKLQCLFLKKNDLCSKAIQTLLKNKRISDNLKQLKLDNNPLIGDEGIKTLMIGCQKGAFSLLQKLTITYVNMTLLGFEELIKQDYIYTISDDNQNENKPKQKTLKSIKLLYISCQNIKPNDELFWKKFFKRYKGINSITDELIN